MKPDLYALLSRGIRSVPIEGSFVRRSHRGHVLLRDVVVPGAYEEIPSGREDHVWLNHRAYTAIPDFEQLFKHLRPGERIRFIADLQEFRKRNGERSVRLECAREVRRLGSSLSLEGAR